MDFKNNIPIYLQVINDIKHKISLGELKLGEKLPSTRELAVKYQINPNTAVRVYSDMEGEGLCFTKRGLGTFVTEDEEKYLSVKKEMANEYVETFAENMRGLGLDIEAMIELLRNHEKLK